MCIASQMICDSDANILDAFDIFEDRSIQSMDLFDPFPYYLHHIAFDRLKSHTLFPCPTSQLIYIFLKFQCALCILNVSVANTVISKESLTESMLVEILMYKENNKDQGQCHVGHQTKPGPNPILLRLQLLSVAQKRIYPFQCLPTYATAKQFAFKGLIRWGVKCFLKI